MCVMGKQLSECEVVREKIILIWLDNELSLFKQNIEILRVNQRIGRLAFLWAVLGLMCSKFLAYLIIVVLEEFVQRCFPSR